MKSHNWADFSVVVESEFLWRVIFDNPPINLVTPEMLVELPELIDAMQAATELRVVSIAKIRGRVRGIGNELSLATDMRFASRQALFGQPETASGNLPGGGGLEYLPRLIGRARALEVALSSDDYPADVASSI
jgi:enoyl-CoA hydratase/carnithine racemase